MTDSVNRPLLGLEPATIKPQPTTTMETLLQRLITADLICCDCGDKYGKYTAGCSTCHEGTCQVCNKTAAITEVRDFGYLQRGIWSEKLRIKEQSKGVADYTAALNQADFMVSDPDNIDELASYEVGGLCLQLTEEEVTYLYNCLDIISSAQVDESDTEVFVSLETKIGELYCDYCIQYELDPVVKAYYEKYNAFAATNEAEAERFQKFKENYEMLVELGFITEGDNA